MTTPGGDTLMSAGMVTIYITTLHSPFDISFCMDVRIAEVKQAGLCDVGDQ